jgi:hypothetical protein
MRNLQLYATGSATATSVAQVTIPSATTIKGVYVSLLLDSITDNGSVRLELTKVPTNQIAVNGALDPFLEIGAYSNFATSGLSQGGQNFFFPLDVQCRQGEVIYVHATVAGTATYFLCAIFAY